MKKTVEARAIGSNEIKAYVAGRYSQKIKGVQLDLFGEKVKIVADKISEKRHSVLSEREILAIAKAIELKLNFDITDAEQGESSIKHLLLIEKQLQNIYSILYGAFSMLKREFGVVRDKDVVHISYKRGYGERYRNIFLNSINSLALLLNHWEGIPKDVRIVIKNEIERWTYLIQVLSVYERKGMAAIEFRSELVRFDRALNQNWITLLFEDDIMVA
ncbi:hypothetical protein HOC80_02160 [archaeon]|jgi:hypothetical protein|nr:hypothetical protein [archaeon]MBT4416885.1 hypothetical protein [archaeon]